MSNQYLAEYMPTWRRIDPDKPPKAMKMLFKPTHGPAVIGVWYEQCGWDWYCPLPKHAPGDKNIG